MSYHVDMFIHPGVTLYYKEADRLVYVLYKQHLIHAEDISVDEIRKAIQDIDNMTWTPADKYLANRIVWC